jgi:hypothetical protein
MESKIKVFAGSDFIDGKQVRVIVATTSRNKAVEALNACGLWVSLGHVTTHFCDTGNKVERATALAAPGEVFAASSLMGKDFAVVPKKGAKRTATKARERQPAMSAAERRGKSDAAKRERGERRLTTWISPDAGEALNKLTGGSTAKGAIQHAIEAALTLLAAQGNYTGMEG